MQFSNFLLPLLYSTLFCKIVQHLVANYKVCFQLPIRVCFQLQRVNSPLALYSTLLDENTEYRC